MNNTEKLNEILKHQKEVNEQQRQINTLLLKSLQTLILYQLENTEEKTLSEVIEDVERLKELKSKIETL